jgi:hypothetical protein
MSDFCLSAQGMAHITRQTGLMDRMLARVGIDPCRTGQSGDPSLWYEARLKCIDCALSRPCMQFLASPEAKGQTASFCPNRTFFAAAGQRVSNLELGGANDGPACLGFSHAAAPDLASSDQQTSSDQ